MCAGRPVLAVFSKKKCYIEMTLEYIKDTYLLRRVAAVKMTTVVTALTVARGTAAWPNSARKKSLKIGYKYQI